MNDLVKFSIYYWNDLREWWRRRENIQQQNENENQLEQVQIEIDRVYGEELEERLERVYLRLIEVNSRRNIENKRNN